jgi:hypothetical protein
MAPAGLTMERGAMDNPMDEAEWAELPELLLQVGKITALFEDIAKFLLLMNGYLPPGTLQSNARLRRVCEILLEILKQEPDSAFPSTKE